MAAQYKQIGNAVPVNLAYHVGRCLVAMLDGRSEHQGDDLNGLGMELAVRHHTDQ